MYYLNLIITIMETVLIVLAVATGVYEVLARAIPTVKNWTIVGNIINVLKIISDALNNRK